MKDFQERRKEYNDFIEFLEQRSDKWLKYSVGDYSYIDKFDLSGDNIEVTLVKTERYDPDERWETVIPKYIFELSDEKFDEYINELEKLRIESLAEGERNKAIQKHNALVSKRKQLEQELKEVEDKLKKK